MTPKVIERDLLARTLEPQRDTQTIVFTNGCFDLLHVGHVRLLQAARALGDVLVVGVNSDDSVRRLKGTQRPLVPQDERAEVLAALQCVDWVTPFDEDTPIETLRILRPNIHVKGGDYRAEEIPESQVLREMGARIHIFPLVADHSTSRLIQQIQ